ncbi:phosphoribosyltransferase domain-containing protein [Mammaliicoccus fleurettii]|uniref:phosphoribosyltransferase domain-containing protein n=1 Tax=Mammaliicoccus fleurettii TaxID=150056 RepID=UPI001AACD3E9|nr:phosphoribosyltransferase domain-containing protein [Mammaliicoccus fleurettii]MBO3062650.1 phosphoribosyltransferase domain-containing protein [Mammaliicoccus fleurettii]
MSHVSKVFPLDNEQQVEVKVVKNRFDFEIDEMLAITQEEQSDFPFIPVSPCLGYSRGLYPEHPLLIGLLLGFLYHEFLTGETDERIHNIAKAINSKNRGKMIQALNTVEANKLGHYPPTRFLGLSERAVNLGQSIFSLFEDDVMFLASTRDKIISHPPLLDHDDIVDPLERLFFYTKDKDFFDNDERIAIIDNHLLNGLSVLNLIKKIYDKYPERETFTVLTPIDLRSASVKEAFSSLEKSLNIKINIISLMTFNVEIQEKDNSTENLIQNQLLKNEQHETKVQYHSLRNVINDHFIVKAQNMLRDGTIHDNPYFISTGRFTLTGKEQQISEELFQRMGELLNDLLDDSPKLVIGVGEFLYIPLQIARYLPGKNINVQGTTRFNFDLSTLKHSNKKISFMSPLERTITHYLYNLNIDQYEEIIVFVERLRHKTEIDDLVQQLKILGAKSILVIEMTSISFNEDRY